MFLPAMIMFAFCSLIFPCQQIPPPKPTLEDRMAMIEKQNADLGAKIDRLAALLSQQTNYRPNQPQQTACDASGCSASAQQGNGADSSDGRRGRLRGGQGKCAGLFGRRGR